MKFRAWFITRHSKIFTKNIIVSQNAFEIYSMIDSYTKHDGNSLFYLISIPYSINSFIHDDRWILTFVKKAPLFNSFHSFQYQMVEIYVDILLYIFDQPSIQTKDRKLGHINISWFILWCVSKSLLTWREGKKQNKRRK